MESEKLSESKPLPQEIASAVKPHVFKIKNLEAYRHWVTELAQMVEATGDIPNQVICIATGGLFGGKLLKERWNVPLAIVPMSRYGADGRPLPREEWFFPKELFNNEAYFGDNALLFDDLTDEGTTLEEVKRWLQESTRYRSTFRQLRTAVVFRKRGEVDFRRVDVEPNSDGSFPWIEHPWVHQPLPVDRSGNGRAPAVMVMKSEK